ncbi:MAG: AraC family transcriptional regulator, partial [Bacteroidota bacterium]
MQFYVLLLMLGALQGIVLGVLLFTQASVNKLANKVLAYLLFFMSYRLLVEASVYYGYAWVNHWSYHLLFEYDWIYGPLIYLYICYYLIKDFKWQPGLWVLFIPVGVEFLFSNWVKIQNFFWDGSTDSLPFLGSESYQLWEHTPFQLVVMSILTVYYSFRSTQLVNRLRTDNKIEITKDGLKWIH